MNSFTLSPTAKKELRKLLGKMKVGELKLAAKVLKNELSFSYSKLNKSDLIDNLYDSLVFNPQRIKSIIEALAEGKINEF
jgi:hypothetical protein